ncbi:YciI family protein [Nocardioides speluncae]|uniref:YciI family protein n=1 Tax=Nocardioides speluncae TaxID=2670337 RepID=UPI000D687F31|nr:YciI family protein [Nocardioides speluncae]
MTKFLYVYHSPPLPADAPEPTPAEMEAAMKPWFDWRERVGAGMVDFGTPTAGGVRVSPDGTKPSQLQVTGYSIIEAPDLDAAIALTDGHPHLAWPGGEIEVHEAQAIPGM